MNELGFRALPSVDVLDHRGQVIGPPGAVPDERHHRAAPDRRSVMRAQAVLELESVFAARRECLDAALHFIAGFEVDGEARLRRAIPEDERAPARPRVFASSTLPLEIDRHQPDRGGVEDRTVLPLARRKRLLCALSVGDVDHHALPVHRAGELVLHHGRLLAHPDDASVSGDHPVLREERREGAPRCDVRGDHPLAVVRVEDVEPELVLGQPSLRVGSPSNCST